MVGERMGIKRAPNDLWRVKQILVEPPFEIASVDEPDEKREDFL